MFSVERLPICIKAFYFPAVISLLSMHVQMGFYTLRVISFFLECTLSHVWNRISFQLKWILHFDKFKWIANSNIFKLHYLQKWDDFSESFYICFLFIFLMHILFDNRRISITIERSILRYCTWIEIIFI